MNRALLHPLATFVSVFVAIAAGNVSAQTTANGPYYATPSWDQTLPSSTRFIVLANFGSQAVLDRETGLVWQRSPSGALRDWFEATNYCIELKLGNRLGWRLPTIQELASLVDGDPANTSSPRLPPGHPFIGVQSAYYWSDTLYFGSDDSVRVVTFYDGDMDSDGGATYNDRYAWCVRGGQGVATH